MVDPKTVKIQIRGIRSKIPKRFFDYDEQRGDRKTYFLGGEILDDNPIPFFFKSQ
jgi:hypothetical protein